MVACSGSNEPPNADGRGNKFEVIGLSTVIIVCKMMTTEEEK